MTDKNIASQKLISDLKNIMSDLNTVVAGIEKRLDDNIASGMYAPEPLVYRDLSGKTHTINLDKETIIIPNTANVIVNWGKPSHSLKGKISLYNETSYSLIHNDTILKNNPLALQSVPKTAPNYVKHLSVLCCSYTFDASKIKEWDISNIENIDGLFFGMDIDITNLDLSNVKSAYMTFGHSKVSGNAANINTINLENASKMFCGASIASDTNDSLARIPLGNCKNMMGMFAVSNFNPTKVYWDTQNVEDMSYLFARDIPPEVYGGDNSTAWYNINAEEIGYIENTFNTAYSREVIKAVLKFMETGTYTSFSTMSMVNNIKTFDADVSLLNTSKTKTMEGMFAFTRITNDSMKDFDTSNVENIDYMFYFCQGTNIDLGDMRFEKVEYLPASFYGNHYVMDDVNFKLLLDNPENIPLYTLNALWSKPKPLCNHAIKLYEEEQGKEGFVTVRQGDEIVDIALPERKEYQTINFLIKCDEIIHWGKSKTYPNLKVNILKYTTNNNELIKLPNNSPIWLSNYNRLFYSPAIDTSNIGEWDVTYVTGMSEMFMNTNVVLMADISSWRPRYLTEALTAFIISPSSKVQDLSGMELYFCGRFFMSFPTTWKMPKTKYPI